MSGIRSGFFVKSWNVCFIGHLKIESKTASLHSIGVQGANKSEIEHTKILEGFLSSQGSLRRSG
jgi:hypothetical protein